MSENYNTLVRNRVYISGEDKNILDFKEFFGFINFDEYFQCTNKTGFTFEKIIPVSNSNDRLEKIEKWGCPEDLLKNTLSIATYSKIYHFRNNPCDTIELKFKTIDNPPFEIYKNLKEMFPKVVISWMYYFEDEMVTFENGDTLLEDFQPNRYFMHENS